VQIEDIVDLEIKKVCGRLSDYEIQLSLVDEVRSYLANKGYDPTLGARPLRRVIQTEVEDALSEALLAGDLREGDVVVVDLEDGELVFRSVETEESMPVVEIDNGEASQELEPILP
jgi:ATP-dependent Clp protease ATP-binding subunit ClpC